MNPPRLTLRTLDSPLGNTGENPVVDANINNS